MKLIIALCLIVLAQILSFVQLQGQMKWAFAKNNPLVMMLFGLPIGLIFIHTTKLFNEHFGVNWPGRLVGQAVGVIMFSVLSWVLFREPVTVKTAICIGLAFLIVAIQIFYK